VVEASEIIFALDIPTDNFKQVKNLNELSKFWIAGINYKKADAATRGQFAIHNDQHARLLERAVVKWIG
jgi:hypothetical protein